LSLEGRAAEAECEREEARGQSSAAAAVDEHKGDFICKTGCGQAVGMVRRCYGRRCPNGRRRYAESVKDAVENLERMLLIDTCGEGAGVAASVGEAVVAVENLPTGSGSAEIVEAVQRALSRAGWSLGDLLAIGVVSGPGSFTGVRVGMAAAKGFSEAMQVRMVTVSRLQVLWDAAGPGVDVTALDAGRGECYLCDVQGREWLGTTEEIQAAVGGAEVLVAEDRVATRLAAAGMRVRTKALSVEDALLPLLGLAREGRGTMTLSDANYVRRESDIYKIGKA
jgi:tRNA threonylcarbamoyladenosine biosynthesis protein TsaB